MKNYFVKVLGQLPYPVEKDYIGNASNMATATARAIRNYRKDISKERGKAIRIKKLSIKVERL